jgi:imidazolonepropionase-like amidohydrolase
VKFFVLGFTAALPFVVITNSRAQPVFDSGTFILHLVAKPAGKETFSLTPTSSGQRLKSHFEYSDRGAPVPLDFTFDGDSELRPIALAITGKSTRFSTLQENITVRSRTVTVERNQKTSSYRAPRLFFVGDENMHGALQELLWRYWNLHGRPKSIPVFPAGDVKIRYRGPAAVPNGDTSGSLEAYTLSGLMWGQESLWIDRQQRIAAIVEPGQFEIVREEYESALPWFIRNGVTNSLEALTSITGEGLQVVHRKIAIVGGVLIDGTGGPPLRDAAVITEDGRIASIGRRAEVTIPKDAFVVHADGKTILPGLWDMHAHYQQVEFGPVYLANGVTTVRDVGNEIDFIPTIRDVVNAGKGVGPRIYFAGIVDGTERRTMGAVVADTPDEAIAIANRYHSLGALQIKIYSSVKPEIVPIITQEAHRLGMTVTGHVPRGMDTLQAISAGMDQINHIQYVVQALLPPDQRSRFSPNSTQGIPALDFKSSEVQQAIGFLKVHGTVVDPTIALQELLAHPLTTAVRNFEPGIDHVAPQLVDQLELTGAALENVSAAADYLRTSFEAVRALHAAGIPIVAGTDVTVPGYSLHRELELYVKAGFTPVQAIQAATIVPARVLGLSDQTGSLELHKRADMLIVDGDPLSSIADLRKVDTVITEGHVYHPAPLLRSVGFKP